MEDTMLELIEVFRQKEFYCKYNDVDDLIESTLNSKLFLIILRSQHHDKKKKEVKNISPVHAFTPVLPTKEPEYSLNIGDEHLSTTPEIDFDEVTKSSVKNLVLIPSEYEVTFDDESECNVPVKDESSLNFTTLSNPIFDDNDDFTSSDDELLSNEDVPMEDFNVYSNFLFEDEEINSNKIDPHYFNDESDLIESLSNRDTLFESYSKFDYLEEFSGEFMLPGIESDDYDSGGDIYIFKELFNNDTPPIPENKSSNINHHDNPSFPRPPLEPLDVEVFFEPDSGVLTTNVVKGISEHYVLMPNIFPTLPTFDPLYPVYETLLSFSLENEDKMFKPGIHSYLFVSHRDKTIFDFFENPLMMYGGDIPLLDV
uniref:Reverse transcriptase domain-containing protein n=1 Tax=Tanacetum cinerariifolium TaxID=118510 RepID=A0A699GTP7_TANCI|nr:hypothetical protein [Tanacetum cinerariifolium]